MKAYFFRIAVAFDALVQAFFHYGMVGITISSRAASARNHGHKWGCVLCWLLEKPLAFLFGSNHCGECIANDIARAKAAIAELEQG